MVQGSTDSTSRVLALLPVKDLTGVKTRLGGILTPDERRLLVRAMAEDVVAALKKTNGLAGIAVITHDNRVADWAKSHKLDLIDDTGAGGLSGAVKVGTDHVASKGAGAALVILADVPFARPEDFEALIDAHEAAGDTPHLVLSTSRDDDGSNGLLVSPPKAMNFHYGIGSAAAHMEEARNTGLAVTQLKRPGIAHDIDTETDLLDLMKKQQVSVITPGQGNS